MRIISNGNISNGNIGNGNIGNNFPITNIPHALSLCTEDHRHVGYCPRYITSDLFKLIEKNPELVKVHVER